MAPKRSTAPTAASTFNFRKSEHVEGRRGKGVTRQGYASGDIIQYEVAGDNGSVFMENQIDIRRSGRNATTAAPQFSRLLFAFDRAVERPELLWRRRLLDEGKIGVQPVVKILPRLRAHSRGAHAVVHVPGDNSHTSTEVSSLRPGGSI
jgi:hypothetical protein